MEKAPETKHSSKEMLNLKIELLEFKIKRKREELESLELDPDDYSDQFDELLDEEGEISICGCLYSPSEILKDVDPINYRCSLVEFVDSMDIEETEEYKDLEEEISDLEIELDRLLLDREETEETE